MKVWLKDSTLVNGLNNPISVTCLMSLSLHFYVVVCLSTQGDLVSVFLDGSATKLVKGPNNVISGIYERFMKLVNSAVSQIRRPWLPKILFGNFYGSKTEREESLIAIMQ